MYTINSSDIINGNVREKIEALYSLCKMMGLRDNENVVTVMDDCGLEYLDGATITSLASLFLRIGHKDIKEMVADYSISCKVLASKIDALKVLGVTHELIFIRCNINKLDIGKLSLSNILKVRFDWCDIKTIYIRCNSPAEFMAESLDTDALRSVKEVFTKAPLIYYDNTLTIGMAPLASELMHKYGLDEKGITAKDKIKYMRHNNKWGVYSNKHLISLPDSFIIEYMNSLKEFNIVSFNGLRYQGYTTNEGEEWFYYKR